MSVLGSITSTTTSLWHSFLAGVTSYGAAVPVAVLNPLAGITIAAVSLGAAGLYGYTHQTSPAIKIKLTKNDAAGFEKDKEYPTTVAKEQATIAALDKKIADIDEAAKKEQEAATKKAEENKDKAKSEANTKAEEAATKRATERAEKRAKLLAERDARQGALNVAIAAKPENEKPFDYVGTAATFAGTALLGTLLFTSFAVMPTWIFLAGVGVALAALATAMFSSKISSEKETQGKIEAVGYGVATTALAGALFGVPGLAFVAAIEAIGLVANYFEKKSVAGYVHAANEYVAAPVTGFVESVKAAYNKAPVTTQR